MAWRVVALTLFSLVLVVPTAFAQTATETEPNNTPATADTAVLGGQVKGHVAYPYDSTDLYDYWVLQARAGDTIYATFLGCGNCYETSLGIELLASNGVTVVAEGKPFDGNDDQIVYVAPTTGPYFLRARSMSFMSGTTYTIDLSSRKCPEDSRESNDTLAHAKEMPRGAQVRTVWCPEGDLDFYRVTAARGTILRWSMRDYAGGYYEPSLRFLGPDGKVVQRQINLSHSPTVAQYEVVSPGTYYLHPWGRGGPNSYYTLQLDSLGVLPESPGDPVATRADNLGGDRPLLADPDGGFWGGSWHLTPQGAKTDFVAYNMPDRHSMAWDGFGNLLVGHNLGVSKFVPPDRVSRLISLPGTVGMAVGPNGLWVADRKAIHKYNSFGHPQVSYDYSRLTPYAAQNLALSPSGELYFSAYKSIYRVAAGQVQLFHTYADAPEIRGIAFDSLGNLYVSAIGYSDYGQGMTVGRVVLHDPSGAVLADPFAWWPVAPGTIAFARNADGTMSRRLYVLDDGKLVELNAAGVRAPGLPLDWKATCPPDREGEPNESMATAHALVPETGAVGASCPAGDQDYFRFSAVIGSRLVLEAVDGEEPVLDLLDATGQLLATTEDTASHTVAIIQYTVPASGTYYARIRSDFVGATPYALGLRALAPEGLTPERAARELARRGGVLSGIERSYLDELGNRNGRFDVGDFHAFQVRQRAIAP